MLIFGVLCTQFSLKSPKIMYFVPRTSNFGNTCTCTCTCTPNYSTISVLVPYFVIWELGRNLWSQSVDSVTRVIRLGTRDSGAKCERLATSTFDSRMWLSPFDSSPTRVIYDVFFKKYISVFEIFILFHFFLNFDSLSSRVESKWLGLGTRSCFWSDSRLGTRLERGPEWLTS